MKTLTILFKLRHQAEQVECKWKKRVKSVPSSSRDLDSIIHLNVLISFPFNSHFSEKSLKFLNMKSWQILLIVTLNALVQLQYAILAPVLPL